MEHSPKPLAGLKVVELGTLIAGPFASRICAEFGAEVIKIESPDGGDPLRKWRKLYEGTSLWWFVQARNKKSLTLNLKHAEGQAKCYHDTSYWKPGHPPTPRLVMVRLSGFGQTGPYKDQPGFGAVGESMGGLRYITGFEDRPPVRTGISIGDSIAAPGRDRRADGAATPRGQRRRGTDGRRRPLRGDLRHDGKHGSGIRRVRFHPRAHRQHHAGHHPPPSHTSADGRHVQIGANGDAIFRRFMQAIGRDDLASDPQLASNDGRDARRDELYGVIDRWVASQPLEEVLAVLARAEVPASRIYSAEDMFRDPQFLAREMPSRHACRTASHSACLASCPSCPPRQARRIVGPELGEHTDALLAELGYDSEGIAALRREGAI